MSTTHPSATDSLASLVVQAGFAGGRNLLEPLMRQLHTQPKPTFSQP